MALQEYDEWIKKLHGKKMRFSYQVLTTGFSASMEILDFDAMIYTHTHIDPLRKANVQRAGTS